MTPKMRGLSLLSAQEIHACPQQLFLHTGLALFSPLSPRFSCSIPDRGLAWSPTRHRKKKKKKSRVSGSTGEIDIATIVSDTRL